MYTLDTSRLIIFNHSQVFVFLSQEALQELQIQIYKFEADIETLTASLKKKKSDRDVSEEILSDGKI